MAARRFPITRKILSCARSSKKRSKAWARNLAWNPNSTKDPTNRVAGFEFRAQPNPRNSKPTRLHDLKTPGFFKPTIREFNGQHDYPRIVFQCQPSYAGGRRAPAHHCGRRYRLLNLSSGFFPATAYSRRLALSRDQTHHVKRIENSADPLR